MTGVQTCALPILAGIRTIEAPTKRPLWTQLYVQVLVAITLGALIGHFWPQTGEALKPLGDAFIKLVKMIIAPVIFLTIVTGIAILVIYGWSLPAVTDYVLFMKVEKTSYLKLRFDFAYFAYVIFAVAALGRYAWLVRNALRGRTAETLLDSTKSGAAS